MHLIEFGESRVDPLLRDAYREQCMIEQHFLSPSSSSNCCFSVLQGMPCCSNALLRRCLGKPARQPPGPQQLGLDTAGKHHSCCREGHSFLNNGLDG